jgi:protochlorophyllide reductase
VDVTPIEGTRMTTWTDAEMTDQSGRVVFVTGATGGLGLETATVLAAHGARVLIGYRDSAKGRDAIDQVAAAATGAAPELVQLDLTSSDSIDRAAATVRESTSDRLDLLVNNAGVMAPPLEITAEGFELQWATNVIGMAALTWRLLPAIQDVPKARIATMTSVASYPGAFDPATIGPELRGEGPYRAVRNYCHTKLADLVFARELQRRLAARGSRAISVAAHPGVAESNIASSIVKNSSAAVQHAAVAIYNTPAQPTRQAAWTMEFALTYPGVKGGYMIVPRGPLGTRGRPTARPGTRISNDPAFARELWQVLEDATGITPGI